MSKGIWLCGVIAIGSVITMTISKPIIVRHDTADSLYVNLGSRFADVLVDLRVPTKRTREGRSGNGVGVLVDSRWVLTAAHVAVELTRVITTRKTRRRRSVIIDQREYEIANVFLNPQWTELGPGDVALVQLKSPVKGHRWAIPYERRDEEGQIITVAGWGD